MLSRREKYMLALLPPLAIVCVQAFFFQPRVEARIQAAEAKLVLKTPDKKADPQGQAAPDSRAMATAVLQRQAEDLEREAGAAEKRSLTLVSKWTKPERRAQVVSDLTHLFEKQGVRLRASQSAPSSDAADVPALKDLVHTMRSLGGAEPEMWRFELTSGFGPMLELLGVLAEYDAFVLPLAIKATSGPGDGRLDIVLWAWI